MKTQAMFLRASHDASYAIALFAMLLTIAPSLVVGVEPTRAIFVANLIQSEDVELPEDFLVRVDSGKLQVALESIGLMDREVPRSNLLVSLINSRNEIQTARSNSEGMVAFDNIEEDQAYALVVAESRSHAAIPVIAVSDEVADQKGITNDSLKMPLLDPNRDEILTAINRDIPPTQGVTGGIYVSQSVKPESLSSYRVQLQSDGMMLGRVIVLDRDLEAPLRYAKLNFFRGNQLIARADSNPTDGSFAVPNMIPGPYGVVAAGPAGYASFGFEVVPAPATVNLQSERGERLVNAQPTAADRLGVCLIPPRMVDSTTRIIRDAYAQPPLGTPIDPAAPVGATPSPTSFAGGGGFGGGGFGGGFGGGSAGGGSGLFGGGFGSLIGLGALAGIAAIIADDDDDSSTNNNAIVTPISN